MRKTRSVIEPYCLDKPFACVIVTSSTTRRPHWEIRLVMRQIHAVAAAAIIAAVALLFALSDEEIPQQQSFSADTEIGVGANAYFLRSLSATTEQVVGEAHGLHSELAVTHARLLEDIMHNLGMQAARLEQLKGFNASTVDDFGITIPGIDDAISQLREAEQMLRRTRQNLPALTASSEASRAFIRDWVAEMESVQ